VPYYIDNVVEKNKRHGTSEIAFIAILIHINHMSLVCDLEGSFNVAD